MQRSNIVENHTGNVRVGILGASGKVGTLVCGLLDKKQINYLKGARSFENKGNERCVNLYDEHSLCKFIREVDVVVNCAGPSYKIKDRVFAQVIKTKAHYIDAFGNFENYRGAKIDNIVVSNVGCVPGLSGVILKYFCEKGYQDIEIATGGRENGGTAALEDIILSGLAGYGKSNAMMLQGEVHNHQNELCEWNVDVPKGTCFDLYLSEELKQIAKAYRICSFKEFKMFADVQTKQCLTETITAYIQSEQEQSRQDLLTQAIQILAKYNALQEEWFHIDVQAQSDENGVGLSIQANSGNYLTAWMLVYTLEYVLNHMEGNRGVYYPYELVSGEELLQRLKVSDAKIYSYDLGLVI